MQYEFAKDTLLFHLTNKETEKLPYQFNAAKNELTIKDSINQVLAYSKVNDSTISLMDKDSTKLYLRKVN